MMNSSGKRKIMQPMGRPRHALKVACFFHFKVGGEGSGGWVEGFFFIFPLFPMCSLYVPFMFPMGSHQVLNMFPNMFSIAPHFYPICFGKLL